ncbi:hypothetical protein HN814_04425 [Candidatus Woesearchaeota archaeon]|jgi:hypothetical protein|nr:hypothetical protein [Candidatus Woesearchaeota archaeon]
MNDKTNDNNEKSEKNNQLKKRDTSKPPKPDQFKKIPVPQEEPIISPDDKKENKNIVNKKDSLNDIVKKNGKILKDITENPTIQEAFFAGNPKQLELSDLDNLIKQIYESKQTNLGKLIDKTVNSFDKPRILSKPEKNLVKLHHCTNNICNYFTALDESINLYHHFDVVDEKIDLAPREQFYKLILNELKKVKESNLYIFTNYARLKSAGEILIRQIQNNSSHRIYRKYSKALKENKEIDPERFDPLFPAKKVFNIGRKRSTLITDRLSIYLLEYQKEKLINSGCENFVRQYHFYVSELRELKPLAEGLVNGQE